MKKNSDILFGYFNINALCTDPNSNLRHMFTNADSFSGHKTTVLIKNIYFSDNDAAILHINPNKNNDVN